MKILYYSKTIKFDDIPVTFDIVPRQEITSDAPFFDQILKAVQASDFEYSLIERREEISAYEHRSDA